MGYYIDLEKISLDAYKERLEQAFLPPSRMLLKEKLEERFKLFKNHGIDNVKQLQQVLRKKDKLHKLSQAKEVNIDYLKVLLREINSLHPKPNKLSDFIGIAATDIAKLEMLGIKNTEKLYSRILNRVDRKSLSEEANIHEDIIIELTKLTDLSRIKWVGATYARILYEIGADTPYKISKSDPKELHHKINKLIKEKDVFKGAIGLNDVHILVEIAGELESEIEY